jgi:hypothetical protein
MVSRNWKTALRAKYLEVEDSSKSDFDGCFLLDRKEPQRTAPIALNASEVDCLSKEKVL